MIMDALNSYSAFAGEIGLASADITPPVGIYSRNWGAAKHDVADSVHRPLTLNVLTLQESKDAQPLILIEADLGFWRELTFLNAILDQDAFELPVSPERVIFTLSHTHAGPRIIDSADVPGGDILQAWMRETIDTARRTIGKALAYASPGLLEWHTGRCQLAANRDLHDPDESAKRRVCGYAPEVNADQTLMVGRVTDPSGGVRAIIANYACHPTTLAFDNQALSPDFVGAFRETVTRNTGDAAVFFLQGASGELAPRYQYVGDTAVADRHGRQLGFATLATLEDMEPPGTSLAYQGVIESGAPLALWKPVAVTPATTLRALTTTVELELKDLPTIEEIKAQLQRCDDRTLAERLNRKLDVRRKVGNGSTFAMPIHAWKVGTAVFIGTMAESYSRFQTVLREQFPDQHLICMNIVNGWVGYLAPQELYDEDIYQVWQSPFARGSLERTIAAAIDLIKQINNDR